MQQRRQAGWVGRARGLALLLLFGAPSLAGCGGGFSLKKLDADHSIVTSALPVDSRGQPAAEDVSDQVTIKNAVTSANIADLKGAPLSWANAETGSQGAISGIGEYQEKGATCRRFQVSRESFAGVALYSGDTCLESAGNWWMRAFQPL